MQFLLTKKSQLSVRPTLWPEVLCGKNICKNEKEIRKELLVFCFKEDNEGSGKKWNKKRVAEIL